MKQLKNSINKYKEIRKKEKTFKGYKIRETRKYTFRYLLFIFLLVYGVFSNLVIFTPYYYLLVAILNLIILTNIFLYYFIYYKLLDLNGLIAPIIKTLIIGLPFTIILWIISIYLGGILWN